jgi:hypothetical protein
LKQQAYIQKFIAFTLLIVFSISIAPKAYFHEVIADHKDVLVCHHPEAGSSCAHSQPLNCHFDDLVVTAAFLIEKFQNSLNFPNRYLDKQDSYKLSYHQHPFFHKTSRGPPVA